MPSIGYRRSDGKIYAGPDYGYQSPATYKKLEKEGAFRVGASAVRRAKQLASQATDAITSRLPSSVKDAASAYGKRLQQSQKQQADLEQSLIDSGGAAGQFFQAKQQTAQRRQQDIQSLSAKTNIAPEILGGGLTAAEMVIDARMGAKAAKTGITNYLKQSPAPVVYASGGSMKLDSVEAIAARIKENAKTQIRPGRNRQGQRIDLNTGGKIPESSRFTTSTGEPVRVSRVEATPGTGVNKGRDYAFQYFPDGPEQTIEVSGGSIRVKPGGKVIPSQREAQSFIEPPDREMPGGSTRKTPKSQAQYDEPAIDKRLKRVHVEDTTPPETFLDVEDVHTSDMPRYPTSDGNQYLSPLYGGDDVITNVPYKERNRQIQAGIDKRTEAAIQARISARKQELDIDGLRREVFISGDDFGKLKAIAQELGVPTSKYTTPSALERALKKKIDGLEKTYRGKPSVSVEERKEIVEDVKASTATGRTQAEVNLLNRRIKPAKSSPRQQGDILPKANTDPDSRKGRKGRREAYGQPPTKEGDFDYDSREKIEKRTAKKDQEYLDKHFVYDPEQKKYVPRKPNRSVSDRVNRRRRNR